MRGPGRVIGAVRPDRRPVSRSRGRGRGRPAPSHGKGTVPRECYGAATAAPYRRRRNRDPVRPGARGPSARCSSRHPTGSRGGRAPGRRRANGGPAAPGARRRRQATELGGLHGRRPAHGGTAPGAAPPGPGPRSDDEGTSRTRGRGRGPASKSSAEARCRGPGAKGPAPRARYCGGPTGAVAPGDPGPPGGPTAPGLVSAGAYRCQARRRRSPSVRLVSVARQRRCPSARLTGTGAHRHRDLSARAHRRRARQRRSSSAQGLIGAGLVGAGARQRGSCRHRGSSAPGAVGAGSSAPGPVGAGSSASPVPWPAPHRHVSRRGPRSARADGSAPASSASSTASPCSLAHSVSMWIGSISVAPSGVSSYSTRGGTSA